MTVMRRYARWVGPAAVVTALVAAVSPSVASADASDARNAVIARSRALDPANTERTHGHTNLLPSNRRFFMRTFHRSTRRSILRTGTTALAAAGTSCQVIVLTCVPDRYSGIGQATVVRMDSTPAPGGAPPAPGGKPSKRR